MRRAEQEVLIKTLHSLVDRIESLEMRVAGLEFIQAEREAVDRTWRSASDLRNDE